LITSIEEAIDFLRSWPGRRPGPDWAEVLALLESVQIGDQVASATAALTALLENHGLLVRTTGIVTLKLVIFDMDQVLCRYDRPLRLQRLAALCGRTSEAIRAAIWDSGFEPAAEAGAYDAEAYLTGFGERMGYRLTRPEWVESRRAAMTPWPDMLALVATVKRSVAVALLTNNGFLTKETIAELFPELPPLFEEQLLFSAEFKARKPDLEVYRGLLGRLGVAPQAALMIDDDAQNIAGAEAAGLNGHIFDGIDGLARRLTGFGIRGC
jgi:HAD superfamily hydrolase (TIGR01509 family)